MHAMAMWKWAGAAALLVYVVIARATGFPILMWPLALLPWMLVWAFVVWLLRYRKQSRLAVEGYLEAEACLADDNAADALEIIRSRKKRISFSGLQAPLTQLEMTLLCHGGDVAGLLAIYADTPEAFYWQELPALMAGEAHIADGRFDAFDRLHAWWQERKGASQRWDLLESDKLQRQGIEIGALEILNRGEMPGLAEAGRLARLALLRGSESPSEAQDLIERALTLAPDDPEVRLFQGILYDRTLRDKRADAAFQYALAVGKQRPLIIDAAAEYYRRSGQLERAVEVWQGALDEPSLDRIWLKVLFLCRVYRSLEVNWEDLAPPPGDGRPLIDFIREIPAGWFWDPEGFQPLVSQRPVLQSRQEVHWLSVLEALRTGKEDEALSLLNVGRFGERSWHQDLETTLIWILTYRRLNFMNPELVLIADERLRIAGRHPLFDALDNWVRGEGKVSDFVRRLVLSDEAFAAACLAAGWHRAGLILHRVPPVAKEAPEWLLRDYEQAVKACQEELLSMRNPG